MAAPNQKNKRSKRKATLIITALAGVSVIFFAMVLLWREKNAPVNKTTPSVDQQARSPQAEPAGASHEYSHLIGRWIRPDGGYVLQIRKVDASGNIDAGYYNPRPINVSRAEASRIQSRIKVFIELRDAGYPGATYTLAYNSQKDVLVGIYDQPAAGQSFNVVFVRME